MPRAICGRHKRNKARRIQSRHSHRRTIGQVETDRRDPEFARDMNGARHLGECNVPRFPRLQNQPGLRSLKAAVPVAEEPQQKAGERTCYGPSVVQ